MLWANVMLAVLIVQVLTLERFSFGANPSQTSVSLGVVLIWTSASYIQVFACGRIWHRWVLRRLLTKRRPEVIARYRHWGMETEVLGSGDFTWLVIATLWSSLTIWFIIWFIAPATTPFEVEPKKMILPLLAFFWMPVTFGMSDYRRSEQKRKALDSLHPAFHARFPVSEILSMYACLMAGHPVFWQEYRSLPESLINKTTNREFRDRVNSYRVFDMEVQHRTTLIVAVVAVAAAVPTLAYLLLEGKLTKWISDVFTAPMLP